MTQIDFYFHVTDKFRLVTTLSNKALTQFLAGIPVTRLFLFTPDEASSRRVEAALWTLQPTSFLSHCRANHACAQETPLIVDHEAVNLPHDEILLNFCPQYPGFFSRFHRLIEVVGTDEVDKQSARERFGFYRDRGYEIRSHDMTGKA